MSKSYLCSLSKDEYNELSKALYEKQCGKCFICNKSIPISLDETNILSLTNRRVFRIDDYALCHKKCNIEGIRDSILKESVNNHDFAVEVSFNINLDEKKLIEEKNKKNPHTEEQTSCIVDNNDELNEENVAKLEYLYDYYWETLGRDYLKDIKKSIKRLERIVKINKELKKNFGCQSAYKSLIELYRECNDKANEERIIKLAIEQFSTPIFSKMLCELNGIEYDADKLKINDLYDYGKRYEIHLKEHLPEFNFYHNYFNPFKYYNFEKLTMLPTIRVIEKHFEDLGRIAYDEKQKGLYENAIELYEQLIAEGDNSPNRYDSLIELYTLMKRKDDAVTTLQHGIKYYEERKAREIEYVRSLAQKYNAEEYCEMCIRLGRPIRYYCGYIVLYQEYPFIDKWKKQLKKLK